MFTLTRPLLKSAGSSSSREWLARQFRDPYVKQRMQFPSAYRSRAAFKLIQIDDRFKIFDKAVWGPRGLRGLKAVEEKLRKEWMGNSTERMSGGSESLPQARADETDNEAGSSTTPTTTASPEPYSRRIVVIDLGAAPGGWSQVVASKFGIRPQGGGFAADVPPYIDSKGKGKAEETQADDPEDTWSVPSSSRSPESISPYFRIDPTIIAVDILPMSPIRGVKTIRQDFLSPDADSIISVLLPPDRPKADVILSDIAVNISGNKDKDEMSGTEVLYAVYRFAKKYLKKKEEGGSGGWLVVKFFDSPSASEFRTEILLRSFSQVSTFKPPASRSESNEAYYVCKGFLGGIYRHLDSSSGPSAGVGSQGLEEKKKTKRSYFIWQGQLRKDSTTRGGEREREKEQKEEEMCEVGGEDLSKREESTMGQFVDELVQHVKPRP